jgi:hypothetical protein
MVFPLRSRLLRRRIIRPLLRRRRRGGITGRSAGYGANASADGRARGATRESAYYRARAGAYQSAANGTLTGVGRVSTTCEGAKHQGGGHACLN